MHIDKNKIFLIIKSKFPKIYGSIKQADKIDFKKLDSLQKINLLLDIEKKFKFKFKTTDFDKVLNFETLISLMNKK